MADARKNPKAGRSAKPAVKSVAKPAAKPVAKSVPVVAGFDLGELRQLIKLVQRTGIGEIELESGGRSVRISADSHHKAITSPMVGTFYRSPAPDADPFVEVGDVVEVGQTVCIIEAMKLMNEIQAEVKGRVVQMVVDNAQPVEFGQKLFLIEPL